jgi:two-component system, LytTR family, sensor kinase
MKKQVGIFLLYFLAFFVGLEFMRDLLYLGFDDEFEWWFIGDLRVSLTGIIAFAFQSLCIYLFLFHFYPKRGALFCTLGYLILFPLLISSRYFIQEILGMWILKTGNYNPNVEALYYFADNIYYTILYSSFGIVYFFVRYARYQQKRINENIKTELLFLKSQINPHFLFNNLNNIYSLVYQKSDQALPAIEKLSSLLRYMLYEKKESVPLIDEIRYIQDYIELQKLRFNFPIQIKFDVSNKDETMIAPLLLIPFVENAFKHGDPEREMKILLHNQDGTLRFEVENSIKTGPKDSGGGVGLENVRRRLELLYPDRHTLKIEDNENSFHITLELQK